MIIVLLILILLILLVWIGGFIYANDFKVVSKKIPDIKKALIIFPHADDEAQSVGGLMSRLISSGIDVYWVILTRGEKGTPNGELDEKLKDVRVLEAKRAADIYHITHLTIEDYPDGGIDQFKEKLEKNVTSMIGEINPDLVITYDLSGLYGHPDHMVTSEVVTEIMKHKFQKKKLWYVSLPKQIYDSISLPEHMARTKDYRKNRLYPTHKIFVGIGGVIQKIKVSYVYESQGGSSSRNMPFPFIPFWFYISLTPYEYYHEVN